MKTTLLAFLSFGPEILISDNPNTLFGVCWKAAKSHLWWFSLFHSISSSI